MIKPYLPLILLLAIAGAVLRAQTNASLSGAVKDPQGRTVAGATLTLFSRMGGAATSTTSDSSGGFRFGSLSEGDYLLRATAPGFAPFLVGNIHLRAGAAEMRDIALKSPGCTSKWW